MPDVLTERFTKAMERMADALEFFMGIHPEYEPEPGKPPLPSSPQGRAIAKAKAEEAAAFEQRKEEEAAAAQAKATADALEHAEYEAQLLRDRQAAEEAANEKAIERQKLLQGR